MRIAFDVLIWTGVVDVIWMSLLGILIVISFIFEG